MKEKNINKKLIIAFLVLFLLAGLVLLFLYSSANLSEYMPMAPGMTNLMYLPMFLCGAFSSFILAALFSVLLFIQIKSGIATKLLVAILAVSIIVFGSFNAVNIIKCYNSYDEETYFSAMDDMDNMLPPEENIAKFFPYYEDMEKRAEQTPYYSFSEYTLDNTIYKITQTECNDFENSCAFTAEYFETDKSYLSGKFISEKKVHYSSDENGEPLDPSLIKQGSYNDIKYDLIEQSTEKMLIISTDNYYFLFNYQDSMGILNLSTQEFINTAFEQFNYLKDAQ